MSFGKKFFTFSRDETTRARTLDETESQREKTFAERERVILQLIMVDDDDDKYNKKKALPVPKFTTRQTTTSSLTPDGKTRKERSMGGGLGGQSSKSAQNSPQNQFDSNRLAAKLDFLSARVNFDGEEETQTKVHNALDRLSFATQVHHTADAFGQALTDAKEEVGEYALKAAESMARFQATQYAAKWMPLETNVNLKPTYVKVPVSTVERLKFYEDENVRQIVAQHLIEKETILAENAGLRSLVPGLQDEVSSEQVANIRETEDGVNRALLLAAVEEIAKLKTRVTVLEGEAAKHRVTSAGFGLIGVNASEHSGEIAEHARKLTTELARVEEDNGRQKWLIGEKDKEIETIKGKFMDTYQYSLEERLQESTEALEVAANLQGEQLQYLEDHALKVLAKKNEKLDDLVYQLETLASHREQTREHLTAFLERNDETVVSILCSLAGFSSKKTKEIVEHRRSRSLTGRLAWLGKNLKPVSSALSNALMACASPPGGIPREGDAILADAAADTKNTTTITTSSTSDGDSLTKAAAPEKNAAGESSDDSKEKEKKADGDKEAKKEEDKEETKKETHREEEESNATIKVPERSRSRPKPKSPRKNEKTSGFHGFDDPEAAAREAKKRAKERAALPAPKLIGRAAEREAEKMRQREKSGFGGFGSEAESSDDSD